MAQNANTPSHIGIIMDGNGRWATGRSMPRLAGHKKGAEVLEGIIEHADDIGVKYLSVYAFSTENWKRASDEVSGLMSLFEYYLKNKLEKFKPKHGRLRFAGRRDRFSPSLLEAIENFERETRDETGIQIILCVDYGGRQELVDAVKKLVSSGVDPSDIDELAISRSLYLQDVPDPDLIIRTSGELRMSNFWLLESAYSELYFTDTLWPDFDNAALDEAVACYALRDRRRGGV